MANNYLKKVRSSESVASLVIKQITDAIINGELKPGDKLPTELELSSSLGVGRNGIREAIKVLEFMGVVEIQHAEGTFVSSGFNVNLFNPLLYGILLKSGSNTDMYNYRESFDMGIVLLVLEIASDESIKKIEEAYERLAEAMLQPNPNCEEIIARDLEFHSSYYNATGNGLIIAQGDMINRVTRYSREKNMQIIIEKGELSHSLLLHKNLLDVIRNRDTTGVHDALTLCFAAWHQKLKENRMMLEND